MRLKIVVSRLLMLAITYCFFFLEFGSSFGRYHHLGF